MSCISTSTNLCAFNPGRERNSTAFCVETLASAGYRVLDVNLCEAMNPESRIRTDGYIAYACELSALCERVDVVFRQSHLPYYEPFTEKDADKRALMEELIRRAIVMSGEMGVRVAVTHPCTAYTEGRYDAALSLERNLAYYDTHLRTARACGVRLALENDFDMDVDNPRYCARAEELTALCDAFADNAHVGICYDFGHAALMGGHHAENLALIGARLCATHIQDNHGTRDEHLLPFFGTTDWRAAMRALARCGYRGDLTFEAQEFGRCLPRDMKGLTAALSLKVGERLLAYYCECLAE